MSTELTIAKHYFDLSNNSDFESIAKLFDENSTFCTRNLEYFIGVENIIIMQRAHHGLYQKLKWTVNSVTEIKSGVICFDFSFEGVNQIGEVVKAVGLEYVIIKDGKIRHIDVKGR